MDMSIKDIFYNWLARKYGWGEETYRSLDEDFQDTLLQEFNEIRRSYGQEIALPCEVR